MRWVVKQGGATGREGSRSHEANLSLSLVSIQNYHRKRQLIMIYTYISEKIDTRFLPFMLRQWVFFKKCEKVERVTFGD